MSNYCYKINKIDSDTLIISFAGNDRIFGGIQRFEFINFLSKHFENVDKHFYVDKFANTYHEGIDGISKTIDETVEYLKGDIEKYKNVIFIGVSAGGYAAILFGSLLNINSVLAFIPPTIRRDKNIDEKYRDISQYINDTTKYYIYGDLSVTDALDCHHISHCERIAHHPNVFIIKKPVLELRKIRDSGELFIILNSLVIMQYPNIQNYTIPSNKHIIQNTMNSIIKNI